MNSDHSKTSHKKGSCHWPGGAAQDPYDVIIVGAGPAGSSAAYELGRDGKRQVLIVDRADFPRYKCCAGGLFLVEDWPSQFEIFRQCMQDFTRFECRQFDFYCNRDLFYRTPDTHLFDVVDRSEFDTALLKAALQYPNIHFRRAHINHIEQQQLVGQPVYCLRSDQGTFNSRKVIGANGFSGVISRFVGNPAPRKSDYGMCLQQDILCDKIEPATTSVFLNWAGELGFTWIFPNASGYSLGLGFIGSTRKPLPVILDEFHDYAVQRKLIPSRYQKRKLKGAPCPVSVVSRFGRQQVLLCGDALGAVRQLTGEGIYYALWTGRLAAQSLLADDREPVARYRRALRPVMRQIVLRRVLPFGKSHKLILSICIRLFSLRLPFELHHKMRKWIVNKFHRMDSLPLNSFYRKNASKLKRS